MKFEPKTDEQIAEENLLPVGVYDFEIIKAQDKQSKAGNDMIELTLKVYSNDGGFKLVNDYLLESLPAKLKRASETCNLLDKYDLGELAAADFLDKSGRVKIGIQKGKEKEDKSGFYPDRNNVAEYIKPVQKTPSIADSSYPDDSLNDTIPF